jgi:hypothetical protein
MLDDATVLWEWGATYCVEQEGAGADGVCTVDVTTDRVGNMTDLDLGEPRG